MRSGAVGGEDARHVVLQYVVSVIHHHTVLLDALQPPPDGVATVVAGVHAAPQEVGDEAVAQGGGVGEDEVAGVLVAAGDEQEATERDERVAAPVAPDAAGEVGQTWRTQQLPCRVMYEVMLCTLAQTHATDKGDMSL